MESLRRSGRKRTANPRYFNTSNADIEEDEDVVGIADQPSKFATAASPQQPSEHASEEYDPAVEQQDEDGNENEVSSDDGAIDIDIEDANAVDNDAAAFSDDVPAVPTNVNIIDKAPPSGATKSTTYSARKSLKRKSPSHTTTTTTSPHELHSRRLRPFKVPLRLEDSFGSDPRDVQPVRAAEAKWAAVHAAPPRNPDRRGVGGFSLSFFQSDAERASNAQREWAWYDEHGGAAALRQRQQVQALETADGAAYLAAGPDVRIDQTRHLLWGPYGQQRVFDVPLGRWINLAEAWNSVAGPQSDGSSEKDRSSKAPRDGWCFNAGEAVQVSEWVPNRTEGPQYLALATWSKDAAEHTSAFTSSGGIRAAIQIWEVACCAAASGQRTEKFLMMDNANEPRLALVLCFDQGLVKDFKWCPSPEKHGKTSLGLLAVVNSDGVFRVLDVELPKLMDDGATEYRHITAAAFESCPPETVCTCVAWISPSTVAVGCANGYVAIWDMPTHMVNKATEAGAGSTAQTKRPVHYDSFHMTFIREIISCQPSRPHLLITSAMDGYVRLTDVRAPHVDAVHSQRSRSGYRGLAWHEQTQHMIGTDEGNTLKALNVRTFFKNTSLCNLEASPLAVATSKLHPVVLIGLANGSTEIFNPLRRLLGSRGRDRFGDAVQRWFKHEWRPGRTKQNVSNDGNRSQVVSAEINSTKAPHSSSTLDFPSGLVRVTAEYSSKVTTHLPSNVNTARRGTSGAVMTTIYEEQTGVRSLAWNPNLACGGWAAAGMGSGLVLVQDLAVDE